MPHRYGDLLAHWQLKAALRGEQPPSTANELMDLMEQAGSTTQASQRFWVGTKQAVSCIVMHIAESLLFVCLLNEWMRAPLA